MSYFTTEQKELIDQIKLLRTMVSSISLHDEPCPLLVSQLNSLKVYSEDLHSMVAIAYCDIKKSVES